LKGEKTLALFKIFKGKKINLPKIYNEGYCYFTEDDGKFYIDTTSEASGRKCLNANEADHAATATKANSADSATRATTAGSAGSVTWDNVSGKPSSFTPSAHTHSEYANQNAFSNIKINSGTIPIAATSPTDTFNLIAGDNVTITNNGANITIGSKDTNTIYTHPTYTVSKTTSNASPAHGATFTAIDSITTNTLGHVTAINTKTVTLPSDANTHYTSLNVVAGITTGTTNTTTKLTNGNVYLNHVENGSKTSSH
jgi:hypothetical protein